MLVWCLLWHFWHPGLVLAIFLDSWSTTCFFSQQRREILHLHISGSWWQRGSSQKTHFIGGFGWTLDSTGPQLFVCRIFDLTPAKNDAMEPYVSTSRWLQEKPASMMLISLLIARLKSSRFLLLSPFSRARFVLISPWSLSKTIGTSKLPYVSWNWPTDSKPRIYVSTLSYIVEMS